MSGIQKFGPFITIGINLVVCGAIVYYFHRRLMSVESAFLKQNQIFSSFMVEFKRDINMQMHMHEQRRIYNEETSADELASPEAIRAVSKIELNKKIEVSDDSASETDASETDASETDASETDASETDDDDSESEADSVEEIKTINLTDMVIDEDDEDSNKVNLNYLNKADLALSNQEIFQDMMMNASMLSNSFMHSSVGLSGSFVIISDDNNMNSPLENNIISSLDIMTTSSSEDNNRKIIILNDEEDSSSSDSDDEAEEEPLKIIKKSTPPPTPSLQPIELQEDPVRIKKQAKVKKNIVLMDMETGVINAPALESTSTATEATSASAIADNMKVDDLRKLAVDKNLVTKDNVKKMKKSELLTLLSSTL